MTRWSNALAGPAVEEDGLAVLRKPGLAEAGLDLLDRGAGEDRRLGAEAERVRGPAEVRLQDLPDVHTRGHAERIQDHVAPGVPSGR